ncbi:serine/threonine protein kinase with extracellular ligand sensor [Herbihabitans rhizosphaerae]|uniref:non-specific serine/threonine protein kinase n=1 Tax=Herbihabitans rhizosphaerae TaxID=1872711 RepID=A0A4Q7KW08_9PSEU|nr:bifunctional serine/threonine-protein kinase/glutamate ABC transporter substrate-binding protein [Herbihabitans rhizosphaerae]RZS40766.1 serine/threonine protein kinase with extracellular ligand sensor [Herbihabitans rhizosphaerae]
MDEPLFGRYRIHELLGRGGMGEVYRAFDTVHQRMIALKRLPASVTDAEFRARFTREARIVANLRHPNVVPVNDFGEIDGQLYLDMLLVDGSDLGDEITAGRIDPARMVRILAQVASALDAAHANGLLHRDVKPSNMLIGPNDHAYLADFGIARSTSAEATALTESGVLVGSLDYIAPERLSSGTAIDRRSDVYSLACVLFQCLTGRLPHPASEPAAKITAHLFEPPPVPSRLMPHISPALDAVVARGMAKNPADRYASASELITAADAALRGATTIAWAAPPPRRQARRTGMVVAAVLTTLAVAAVLITGLAAPGWMRPADDDPPAQAAQASAPTTSALPAPARTGILAAAANGRLRVGVRFDMPGIGQRDSAGVLTGFDIDIARSIARALGVDTKAIEFKSVTGASAQPALTNGQVDFVVASYIITEERKKAVDFVGPYLLANADLLARTGDSSITGAESLRGKKVCVLTGSTLAATFPQRAPGAEVVSLPGIAECVAALTSGQVDAVANDNTLLAGQAMLKPGQLRLVNKPFGDSYRLGIAVNKNDPDGRRAVAEALERFEQSGEWRQSLRKAFGGVPGFPIPDQPPAVTER